MLLENRKPLARKRIEDLEWTMNILRKQVPKAAKKLKKNCINQSQIAACEQKITIEKASFCSNTITHSISKLQQKKYLAVKSLAFLFHFLFRRDHNHHFNLTSIVMKICEQILKKDSTPMQFKFFSLYENKSAMIAG